MLVVTQLRCRGSPIQRPMKPHHTRGAVGRPIVREDLFLMNTRYLEAQYVKPPFQLAAKPLKMASVSRQGPRHQ
jgi:hypothetical protein